MELAHAMQQQKVSDVALLQGYRQPYGVVGLLLTTSMYGLCGRLTGLSVDEIRYIYIPTVLLVTGYISEHTQNRHGEREQEAKSLRITRSSPLSD